MKSEVASRKTVKWPDTLAGESSQKASADGDEVRFVAIGGQERLCSTPMGDGDSGKDHTIDSRCRQSGANVRAAIHKVSKVRGAKLCEMQPDAIFDPASSVDIGELIVSNVSKGRSISKDNCGISRGTNRPVATRTRSPSATGD